MKLSLNENSFQVVVGMTNSQLVNTEWDGNNFHLKIDNIELLMDDENEIYNASGSYADYLNDKYSDKHFKYRHKRVGKEIEMIFQDVSEEGNYCFKVGYDSDEHEIYTNTNEVTIIT